MKSKLKQPDLSIVIPAYREAKRIGKTLDELAELLTRDKFFKRLRVEVIVVSADSPDKTHQIVESKQHLFKQFVFTKPGPKVGKGRDVQAGMLRATGQAIIFMDADLATPLRHLKEFYKIYQKGADVVVGTRNLRAHHSETLRRLLSMAGNILFRIAGGVWIEDSQCGFKMFSHHAARLCFTKLSIMGWGFDMEVLAIAHSNNLHIESRRIDDWISMPDSTFTDNPLKNALVSLGELILIASRRLRGSYKI